MGVRRERGKNGKGGDPGLTSSVCACGLWHLAPSCSEGGFCCAYTLRGRERMRYLGLGRDHFTYQKGPRGGLKGRAKHKRAVKNKGTRRGGRGGQARRPHRSWIAGYLVEAFVRGEGWEREKERVEREGKERHWVGPE